MTNVSDLLRAGGGGGPFLTDPRDWERNLTSGIMFFNNAAGTRSLGYAGVSGGATQSADLWDTVLPRYGAAVMNTAWVADTYKTIMDVAGRGFVYNIISPDLSTVGGTLSVRITMDGSVYEFSESVPHVNSTRMVLGGVGLLNSVADPIANNDEDALLGFALANAAMTAKGYGQPQYLYLLEALELHKLNQVLKYTQGFKVEMKSSLAISVDSQWRRHSAGVRYRPAN